MRAFSTLRLVLLAIGLLAVVGESLAAEPDDIHQLNRRLGRGINLGNALDAPKEGEWGVTLRAEYFTAIREAGFHTVRLPVRWSAHAAEAAPFTIDETFAKRVDWALDQAEKNKLNVVLNVHHYGEMDSNPDEHLPRLNALWRQIGERYRDRASGVYFELFNEPHDKFVDEQWNSAIPQLLATIRRSNPTRPVIIGPPFWNAIWALDKLKLPADDKRLILTIHYYEPFDFTHQGASWVADANKWLGRKWSGSEAEQKAVREAFDKVATWASERKIPVYLGEFGAYQAADMESRVRWTTFIAREAERRNFSWSYWEFCAGFGAYDAQTGQWREPLKAALIEPR